MTMASKKPMDPYDVIKHPSSTEKSIRLMESENTLVFVVDIKANEEDIRKAVEKVFNVKVERVNTFVSTRGTKKAYIKFSSETPAIDIATQMGLM